MSGSRQDPIVIDDEPNLDQSLELFPRGGATVMNHDSSLTMEPAAPIPHRRLPRNRPYWIHVHLVLSPEEFKLLAVLLYLLAYLFHALVRS